MHRAGRRGLLWIALVLLAVAAGVDLSRERDSLIRSALQSLDPTRRETSEELIDDVKRTVAPRRQR